MDKFTLQVGNNDISVTLNKFAKQADGSVFIEYGNTQILTTAVVNESKSGLDFFPLTINYDEKYYAVGKIPGNYPRREARPSDQATLSARLIDRPIRPMFPDGYKNEIQVVCTVMGLDHDFIPDILAINAASLSLLIAKKIPFTRAVSAVNVGYINGEFIINPDSEQRKISELDLKLAGTDTEINMVEASANELSEDIMVDALLFGHEEIKRICSFQHDIFNKLNIDKIDFIPEIDEYKEDVLQKISLNYSSEITDALKTISKAERGDKLSVLKDQIVIEYLNEEIENSEKIIKSAFDTVMKDIFRKLIINDKYRVDGRTTEQLRSLESEIDLIRGIHGSAMFTRGETQVLAGITLGVKNDAQLLDGLEEETEKTLLLHYNFPPFSVGETGRMGAPGRREIGHGHLAEMAISKVMPSHDEFPYTVKITADVLESNGSSSQATICASSLALMQAGVPIKKPVAGIAMGLITDDENYTILTDIQGLEDHLGDMDFKVSGTKDGICAIQMDIKVNGISRDILQQSLDQAKIARLQILDNMNNVISIPNDTLAASAPKVVNLKIKEYQIKEVIGRGGDTINKIIEETNVKIDIEEDGNVFIFGIDQEMIDKAKSIILKITKEYNIGEKYLAKVVRIENFGAFVHFEDTDALLHISQLSKERVDKVEDVLSIDQEVEVEIIDIDKTKRIKVKLIQKEQE